MSGFASPASLTDRCFERISDIMYDAIGLSLSDAKKPLVTSRLGPRIQRLGLDGYEPYLALIYVGLSLVLCVLAAAIGYLIGAEL